MTEENYAAAHPKDVFDWLRVVFVALACRKIAPKAAALAGFVAFSGEGASGEECWLDEPRLMEELNVSRATLYRLFTSLRDEGWFEQTRKPAYTGKRRQSDGKQGRRARYRVSWPRLDLRHDQPAKSSLTTPPPDEIRQPVDEPSRVSNQGVSCLMATPDGESLTTPDVPTPLLGHPSASTQGRARPVLAPSANDATPDTWSLADGTTDDVDATSRRRTG